MFSKVHLDVLKNAVAIKKLLRVGLGCTRSNTLSINCGLPHRVQQYSSFASGSKKPVQKQVLKAAKTLDIPKVSHVLRKFYLKVHPDLYESYPVQREKNEESFKKINQFLQSYRDNSSNNTNSSCDVEFYYKLDQEKFKHVKYSMSMPNPSLPPTTRDFMVKRNITQLLSSFDIHIGEFDLGDYSPYYHTRMLKKDDVSIIKYIISASLFFRGGKSDVFSQWEKKVQSLLTRNENAKKQANSMFGVKFAMLIPVIYFNGYTDRLMRLGEYFEKISNSNINSSFLKDRTIVFVNKFVPWTDSKIMLDVSCMNDWPKIISACSTSYLSRVLQKQRDLANLADQIKKLLNLKSVEWDWTSFFSHRDDLELFLTNWKENIISNPENWKMEFSGNFNFSILLISNYEHTAEEAYRSVQMASSTVLVPIKMPMKNFCQDIVANSYHLSNEFASFERNLQEVKKFLKIQELYINPLLDVDKISDFMTRIRESREDLVDYFNGTNICVNDQYSIDPEHKLITIKYNFVY